MNFYDFFMSPLEKILLHDIRKKLISRAAEHVLEIGAGTGANFKYYNTDRISSLNILDVEVDDIAKSRAPEKTTFTESINERFPFDDDSFNTVVETLVICSVEEDNIMMEEIRRVLKPDGLFIHIDHGMPNHNRAKKLFNLISPLWYKITKSCRIDKNPKKNYRRCLFYYGL